MKKTDQNIRSIIDEINAKAPTVTGTIRAVKNAQRAEGEPATYEISISSEAPYERWFGSEILGHQPNEVKMSWLNSGNAPLLLQHDHSQQIGVIDSAKLDGSKCIATIRFGTSALAKEIQADVDAGIRKNVSVGYRINEMVLIKQSDEIDEYRVTDWEPYEASIVSVPADQTVGTNRSNQPKIKTKSKDKNTMKPEELAARAKALGLNADASLESVLTAERKAARTEAEAEFRNEQSRQNAIRELAAAHRGKISDIDQRCETAVKDNIALDSFRGEILDCYTSGKVNIKSTAPLSKKEKRDLSKFSLTKACRELCESGSVSGLTGLEKEMHQEGLKEAQGSGVSLRGFAVPSIVMQRDFTVATEGTDLVQTGITGFIDALRSKMTLKELGATMLMGLTGNIQIPKLTGTATAAWEGENDANAESTPTTGNLSLSPKRLGTFIEVSNQMLMQSSLDVEMMLRNDLTAVIARAIESAAINGTGANDQPTGILATSGIGAVAGGTNGLAPTLAHIIDLETAVAVDNADLGALAYLTNTAVRGKLKKTAIESGAADRVWDSRSPASPLNGYNAGITNLVPSNLTKGTAEDICSAILFGNFNDLIIAGWGGFEIRPNPYIKDTENLTRLTVNTYADVGVRHAESFAAMKDALTA